MSELPIGWVPAEIGFICDLINGKAFKPSDWTSEGLPIVRIQNLNKPDAPYNRFSGEVRERFRLHGGELLFAWSGTPGTSFGAHIWNGGNAVLNQHIYNVCFPEAHIDKKFLKYAINQKLDELIDLAHGGVGLRHVTKGMVERTRISLPPQNEQRRIVKKVDSLLGCSMRAQDELVRIPRLIERYKQAVLTKAFQGGLTEDWRRDNRDAGKEYKAVLLSDLVQDIRYGTSKKCTYDVTPYPVLRIPNISEGRVNRDDLKFAEFTQDEVRKLSLQNGDILVIRSNGSLDLVGRAALVQPGDEGSLYAGYLIRLRPDTDKVLPKFLTLAFAEQNIRRTIELMAKSTSGVKNINSKQIASLVVHLPSLEEQQEIVTRIEGLFAWTGRIAQQHQSAAHLLSNLDQALLIKAFRGELVPQDPDDEPASVLLERIREERAKQPKTKRGRKKKEAKT